MILKEVEVHQWLATHYWRKLTTEEMSNILNIISVTKIRNHLHIIWKSYKAGVWVSHELTEKKKAVRVSVCQSSILKLSLFLNVLSLATKSIFCFTNSHRKNNRFLQLSSIRPHKSQDLIIRKLCSQFVCNNPMGIAQIKWDNWFQEILWAIGQNKWEFKD